MDKDTERGFWAYLQILKDKVKEEDAKKAAERAAGKQENSGGQK